MAHHVVTLRGRKVHYWVKNSELSNTIVCLHGFRGSHRSLASIAMGLNNYRVIALDLPGCGLSDPLVVKHGYSEYADWLDEFAEHLHLGRFTLLCHSLSAAIGIAYAHKLPHKIIKMILITPVRVIPLGL